MQKNTIWEKELELIASIVAKTPLETAIKWGTEVFTYNGKNVMSYGGFKNHFAIWFNNGVFLSDPYGVLIAASGGKTRSLRQWRFTSIDEIDEKKILEYISEAIENEKMGLRLKPEKFQSLDLPLLLSDALQQDKTLKAAFDKLTPGKQKEYILHINDAKQESTMLKRLEKIKPMIQQGVGLYDKYKK